MTMIVPAVENLQHPSLAERDIEFLTRFLEIVRQYARNRTLLFAWIFCARALGFSTGQLAEMLHCTDRNVRYILAEVRDRRCGEGKTGRPPKSASAGEPEADTTVTLGITRFGGLWALLPWILSSNLLPYCQWLTGAALSGHPVQFVLTLLALAVCGLGRIWTLNDLSDRGFALFTGRWTPLRASQVYAWLGQVNPAAVGLFYQGTKVEEWRLVRPYPAILSNDEHVVGHQGGPKMPKGKVSKNGRCMPAHHLFMTFHLAARRFMGLRVTTPKQKLAQVAAPMVREMQHAQRLADGAAHPIFEIFDRGSYGQEAHRDLLAIHAGQPGEFDYLAQIRRTAANVRQWDRGLQWGEYDLYPYVRGSEWDWPTAQQHRLCLACTTTQLTGLDQPLPTLLIIDLDKVNHPDPKAKYAAAFAMTADWPAWVQADLYPWRQDHELAFRDSIHALGLDAKPKGYQKDNPDLPFDHPEQTLAFSTHCIELVAWIKALTYNRIRDLLDHLPEPAPNWTVLTAIRKLIHRTALLQVRGDCLWVTFDPFPDDWVLSAYCEWVNATDLAIPWLNHIKLRLSIADQPLGASLSSAEGRKLLFSP